MEFKVRTKKLKGSTGDIRTSWLGLKKASMEITSVMNNVNIGNSTGQIKSTLKKSNEKLEVIQGATSKIRTNLQAIASHYEITEIAIKNQRNKKMSLGDLAKIIGGGLVIGGATIQDIWGKGKKWWNKYVGDPVAVESGNFILEIDDLQMGTETPFTLTRFYNSSDTNNGAFGLGWTHNYEMQISINEQGAAVRLGDGSEEVFTKDNKNYVALGGTATLEVIDGKYHYTTIDNDLSIFDEQGTLLRAENANGFGYDLEYEAGKLIKVIRDNGDSFEFKYSEENPDHIESVTDHSGRSILYKYNGRNLTSVTSGDRVVKFDYDSSGCLSDVVDSRGVTVVHNEYDDEGRVSRQFFPDGSEMRYTYDKENAATTVTEKNGSESYHFHDELLRNTDNVYTNGTESFEYNDKNLVTSEKDLNENEIKYQYDNRGNISKIVRPDGVVINMTYEKHNKPVTISVNGVRKIKNAYDSKGNLLEAIDALGRKVSYKYNEKGLPIEMRLPSGRTVELSYDEKGNLNWFKDPQGVRTSYEYDELNRIISSTDATNNTSNYEYDRYGNLTRFTDAAGNSRRFKFNEINSIEEFTDFNGATTRLSYNKLGFVSRITDPLGRITEEEYDDMWNVSSHKLPNGATVHFEYDENGNVTKEIDPMGNESTFEYDGNNNLKFSIDPEGAVAEFRYDNLDNLIYVKDPEGNETEYEYDANNNLVHIKDANGGEVHLEYDDADQLICEKNALGETRKYAYTPDGDVSKVIDEAGRVTTIEYDSIRKPSKIAYPDGREQYFTYDINGRLESQGTNRGYTVRYEYDAVGNVIAIRDNNGANNTYTYDAVGNMTSSCDCNGNKNVYEYTLTGKLSSVTDELGCRTEYVYDALDMLVEIKKIGEGEIHKTECVRDLCGNIVSVTDPLGYTEKFVYNGRGELTQAIDKDGYLTQYGYDRNGELNSVKYDDGREIMMQHDALGKLSEVSDWTGITKVESDILGRITKVIYPDNRSAEYTYGKAGERLSVKHPDGRVVSYGYDKAMRLTSLKEGDTDVRYGYDDYGYLISKTVGTGLATSYAYDNRGLLTEIKSMQNGKLLDSSRITYDSNGERTSIERFREGLPEESGLFEFGYDPTGRLASVKKNGAALRSYEYDAFGNRKSLVSGGVSTSYTYDAMDRLLEAAGPVKETFRYDKRGNVIERAIDGKTCNSYVYDPAGKLAEAANGLNKASYTYNGLGHRIEETILGGADSDRKIKYTVDMTKYFNNLFERSINGKSEAYIFDGTFITLKGETDYNVINDDKGSPIRLLGMDGSNAETYGYDEFGTSLYEPENSIQPLRYIGYRNDPTADMYFAQAREYMPEHGRFAGQDPVKGDIVRPITLNPYLYCANMPFTYYDPEGRFLAHLAAGAIGAIGGAVVGGGMELGKQLIGQIKEGGLSNVNLKNVNWGKVGTSALGGAVEGGVLGLTGNPVLAGAAGGFVGGFAEAKFVDKKGWGESIACGAVDAAIGAAVGAIGKKLKTFMPKWYQDLTANPAKDFYEGQLSNLAGVIKVCSPKTWGPELLHTFGQHIKGAVVKEFIKKIQPSAYIKKLAGGFTKCLLRIA